MIAYYLYVLYTPVSTIINMRHTTYIHAVYMVNFLPLFLLFCHPFFFHFLWITFHPLPPPYPSCLPPTAWLHCGGRRLVCRRGCPRWSLPPTRCQFLSQPTTARAGEQGQSEWSTPGEVNLLLHCQLYSTVLPP